MHDKSFHEMIPLEAADHRTTERRVLLAAFAQSQWDRADDHAERRHKH